MYIISILKFTCEASGPLGPSGPWAQVMPRRNCTIEGNLLSGQLGATRALGSTCRAHLQPPVPPEVPSRLASGPPVRSKVLLEPALEPPVRSKTLLGLAPEPSVRSKQLLRPASGPLVFEKAAPAISEPALSSKVLFEMTVRKCCSKPFLEKLFQVTRLCVTGLSYTSLCSPFLRA